MGRVRHLDDLAPVDVVARPHLGLRLERRLVDSAGEILVDDHLLVALEVLHREAEIGEAYDETREDPALERLDRRGLVLLAEDGHVGLRQLFGEVAVGEPRSVGHPEDLSSREAFARVGGSGGERSRSADWPSPGLRQRWPQSTPRSMRRRRPGATAANEVDGRLMFRGP